jgi:hypothetical protein
MKFFEKRDLSILHFVLTVILLIGLIANSVVLGIFYSDYIKNFDGQQKIEKNYQDRIESLEKKLNLKYSPNKNGEYSHKSQSEL